MAVVIALVSAGIGLRAQRAATRSADAAERSATAAERSANAGEHGVDEARRSRLDPQLDVVVDQIIGTRPRWLLSHYPKTAEPVPIDPGRELIMPGNADEKLYLGAGILIRNEGPTTAILDITGSPLFVDHLDNRLNNPVEAGVVDSAPRGSDNAYLLPVGQSMAIIMREGLTITELVDAHGVIDVTMTLRASSPNRSVTDTWTIGLQLPALGPMPGDASHWRVLAWILTEPALDGPHRTYERFNTSS